MTKKISMILVRPDSSKMIIYESDLKWITNSSYYMIHKEGYTPYQKVRLKLLKKFMAGGDV